MISMSRIEQGLVGFLSELLARYEPDLIVCCERKATAIMRALIEDPFHPKIDWPWAKVLSSAVLLHFDWSSFEGATILLFDELVHHGNWLQRSKEQLSSALRGAGKDNVKVITAGFAVWAGCEHPPDIAYYGAIDTETYERKRGEIVDMLQEHGSLLLDTEHLEISVRLQCGLRDFYDALARCADAGHSFSFVSWHGRINLTVDQPDILDATFFDMLPAGSNLNKVVRKVRVLERTHEKFSIVPIFYPNTKCVVTEEWLNRLPSFVDREGLKQSADKDKEIFYVVALLCSIELLRSVVVVLDDLRKDQKIILETPLEDTLPHLQAMYPSINIHLLQDHVDNIISSSRRIKPSRKNVFSGSVPEDILLELCGRVMFRLVEELQDRDDTYSWGQMMRVAEEENEKIGLDPRALTVVVDRLIDNGLLVTSTKPVVSSTGDPFVIRTFAADGEVVSTRIRQQRMVRKPQWRRATLTA